jgi:hypothetical protein
MKKRHLLSLLLCTTVLSGCASMFEGTTQNITVSTINDKDVDKTRCNIVNEEGAWNTSPNSTIGIHKDGNVMDIQCKNDFQNGISHVEPSFNGGYIFLDILLDACIISCIVDGTNNSFYEYPHSINVQMNENNKATSLKPVMNKTVEQTPAPSYQNMPVTQTAVENTMPSYEQSYQQPQAHTSGKDLRGCLALVDNALIAKCVKASK